MLAAPSLITEPSQASADVRHNLAADLDVVDEKRADDLYKQAEQISDEEVEDIMREILEEHRHSTSSCPPARALC